MSTLCSGPVGQPWEGLAQVLARISGEIRRLWTGPATPDGATAEPLAAISATIRRSGAPCPRTG